MKVFSKGLNFLHNFYVTENIDAFLSNFRHII